MRWRVAATSSPVVGDQSARHVLNLEPIERFIREVIPVVPGGRQRITDTTGHLELIRRAAEDRGLTPRIVAATTWYYDGRMPVGGMTGWVPSLVGREAKVICGSKHLTKQMLDAAGVPTPDGVAMVPDQLDAAVAHLRTVGRPLVLKPTTGRGGQGITTGITTDEQLRVAWTAATSSAGESRQLVLEDHVDGIDIRAYVVGRRVVAAATRIHAHVVGDGRQTITELIEEKQRWRDEHVLLRKRPFTVDPMMLARRQTTVDDVPAAGEVIVVNGLANLHLGGEGVDVTELAHPDLFTLAVDAVRAVPGLGVAGVDLLTPGLDSAEGAVVLELNVGANMRVHSCPAYGRPRDVAGALIDRMIAMANA